jgi:hypothetical protein
MNFEQRSGPVEQQDDEGDVVQPAQPLGQALVVLGQSVAARASTDRGVTRLVSLSVRLLNTLSAAPSTRQLQDNQELGVRGGVLALPRVGNLHEREFFKRDGQFAAGRVFH